MDGGEIMFSFYLSFFPLTTEGAHTHYLHKVEDNICDYPSKQPYLKTTILKDKLAGILIADNQTSISSFTQKL